MLPGCLGSDSSTPSPTSTGPAPAPRRVTISALRHAVRGKVIAPRSSGYQTAAEGYNEQYDGARPLAVVEAADSSDVQAAVRWAGQRGVRVLPPSGGHSYAGYSTGNGALVIDLKHLSKVDFDRGSGIATIGPGAQLIDVYSALSAKGVTVPAGSCPSVCIGGLAPAGGMGLAGRKLGLTCDNIEGLEVVTADGEPRQVSSRSEPNLYWAFRGGGGGNFGVATSFRMRAHPVGSAAWFSIVWPWASASDALAAWQDLVHSAPDELTSIFHLSTDSSPSVSANGQNFGSEAQLTNLLGPLRAIGGNLSIGTDSYMDLMLRWTGCLGQPLASCHTVGAAPGGTMQRERFIAKSDYVAKPLSSAGRAPLIAAIDKAQSGGSLASGAILLDSYGGKINSVAADATAFVHRDDLFAMQYLTYLNGPAATQAAEGWIESAWGSMRDHVSGRAYQGYIDPKLKDWEQAYYGPNYPRLQQVKQKYDPESRFSFRQAIKPA